MEEPTVKPLYDQRFIWRKCMKPDPIDKRVKRYVLPECGVKNSAEVEGEKISTPHLSNTLF